MKFGKDFKRQMVPEWADAYMNFNGLKRILRVIVEQRQSMQHSMTPLQALHRRLALHHHHPHSITRPESESDQQLGPGDIEDQVTDIDTMHMHQDVSQHPYATKFLRESEDDGGELEAKFFNKLDEELNKVNNFYRDKVKEVMDEAASLHKQMDALVAMRTMVNNLQPQSANMVALTNDPSTETTFCQEKMDLELEIDSSHPPQPNLVHGIESGDGCTSENKQDPFEILERVKINNTLESPISTLKGVFKDSKEGELTFNKNELKKVEDQLRLVFIEFYQKLRLLKQYSFMNLAAFSKILKKYEKVTSRTAASSYIKMIDSTDIGSSEEVSHLLKAMEITFVKHFSNSNRREGMKSLRPKVKREKHSVTFFAGFFTGCSVALLIAVVLRVEARKLVKRKEGAAYMLNTFPLYSLFAYIVLHMLMYSANIYFWRRYRVNYTFIFGFKQGTELSYREVFLLSSGLAVLTLAGILINLHLDTGSEAQHYKTLTEMVPLGLVAVVLVIMICPFDIIYRSSRFFFIRTLFHCICAPLYKDTLPDFFLADHLTSQVQAIRSIELFICYYGLGEYSRIQNKCHSHGAYNTFYFIIAVIPFWLRLLQCLRRFCEERDSTYLYNGLKYSLTIVAVLLRTAFELKKGMTWMVLALISSAFATMMNTYWDIVLDWGLLQRNSRNKYLRDKLVVSHKSVYFVAMVLNVILRLAWLQLVLEFKLNPLRKTTSTIVISCLEVIRRGIWSFFRLENEHLNNVGKYRAVKAVPFPFNYYDEPAKDD